MDRQLALILGGITAVGVAAWWGLERTASQPCQLCQCNGGVVGCPIPGHEASIPAGQTCAMCNGAHGSVVPCLQAVTPG